MTDTQTLLSTTITNQGTSPHPLRFFRTDRPISFTKPSRAYMALGGLLERGLSEGQVRLDLGPKERAHTHLIEALSTQCHHPHTLRSLVVAGRKTGRALIFSDGSVLFARQVAAHLTVWPAIAWLRREGPRLHTGGPLWGVAARVGTKNKAPELVLAEGQSPSGGRGTALGTATTWWRDPVPESPVSLLLDRMRTAIDATTDALFAHGYCLDPKAQRGTPDWPKWLPWRTIADSEVATVYAEALPGLLWLASGIPDAQTIGVQPSSWVPAGNIERRPLYIVVHAPGKRHTCTLDCLLDTMPVPAALQPALHRLCTAGWGRVFQTRHTQGLPHLGAPTLPDSGAYATQTSAHDRLVLIRRYGAVCPNWANR